MPIELLIDMREARLHGLLQQRLSPEDQACIRVVPLEVGDAEVRHTDPDIRIIIERKTEKDLGASLKDGRYHEQKARMMSTLRPQHCIYLVENPYKPTFGARAASACSLSAYQGAVIHTMFRDGIHVVITRDTSDTADWIATIFEKCRANPSKFLPLDVPETPYIACSKIKTRRLENVDRSTCYLLQLGQLPGVSHKLAQAIASAYPSWRRLLAALDAARGSGGEKAEIGLLSGIPLIGPKKAKTIVEYLKETVEEQQECSSNLSESPTLETHAA